MRTDLTRRLIGALIAGIAVVWLGLPAQAEEPVDSMVLDDAVLRWGLNNEANNRSPQGRMNFLSAGQIAKPADGELKAAGWSQSAGQVAIEKWDGKSYRAATWGGLSTDSAGKPITGFMSGSYTNHQVVFRAGKGTVDRAAGTARIEWTGSASVVFYGGMVFFYLSDPVLEVADGLAKLTGTVSGYGSSIDNPEVSFPVAPRQVTLADFGSVSLGDLGFTATPSYDAVQVVADGAQRVGSFPQSFVTAMELFGTSPFWYASGSSLDPAKRPLPVTVNFTSAAPNEAPPEQTPKQQITNQAKTAPSASVTNSAVRPAQAPIVQAPPVALPQLGSDARDLPLAQQVPLRLVAAKVVPPISPGWWIGGALFGAAFVVLTLSVFVPVKGKP